MLTLIEQYMQLEETRARPPQQTYEEGAGAGEPPGAPIPSGQKIYVEKVDMGNAAAWRSLLLKARAVQVHDRLIADIYVATDPTNPGQRVEWCAFLAGRTLCTLEYIQSAGERGTALTYRQTVNSRRQIWISKF